MTKGKKRLVIAGSAGLAVAIAFAWLTIVLTSEHPDYVEAAKGLENARSAARLRYGPLTWDEQRKAEGRVFRDDSNKWQQLSRSIPSSISARWQIGVTNIDYKKTFEQERAWFESIPSQVEPLSVSYDTAGTTLYFESFTKVKELTKACYMGLIGSADTGDAESTQLLGDTCRTLMAKVVEEPSVLAYMVAHSLQNMVLSGIVNGAVRNRTRPEILEVLSQQVNKASEYPPLPVLFGGEARGQSDYFDMLRALPPGELDAFLDIGDAGIVPPPRGLDELVLRARKLLTGKELATSRRTGPNTVDALEARELEYLIAFEEIADSTMSFKDKQTALRVINAQILKQKDRSYEASMFAIAEDFLNLLHLVEFQQLAAKASIDILRAFPDIRDLPKTLDVHFLVTDPYTGKVAKYERLSTGFVLYCFGPNGRDEGIAVTARPEPWGGFYMSTGSGDDWGYYIQY
jgi:hypothetical protein